MPMRELSPEVGDGLIFQAAVSTDQGMLMTTFQPVIDAVAQTRVRELAPYGTKALPEGEAATRAPPGRLRSSSPG